MFQIASNNYTYFVVLISILYCFELVTANSDGQCCRKRIECFECDSRFDPRCGDPFNLTRDTGNLIYCDDLCVKLKHKFGNQFYYIRSCADQFKKIYIKKTDVCYTTRTKDGGNLCFCDQELCNNVNSIHKKSFIFVLTEANNFKFNPIITLFINIMIQISIVTLLSTSF